MSADSFWISRGAKVKENKQSEMFRFDAVYFEGGEMHPTYHFDKHPAICEYGKKK